MMIYENIIQQQSNSDKLVLGENDRYTNMKKT